MHAARRGNFNFHMHWYLWTPFVGRKVRRNYSDFRVIRCTLRKSHERGVSNRPVTWYRRNNKSFWRGDLELQVFNCGSELAIVWNCFHLFFSFFLFQKNKDTIFTRFILQETCITQILANYVKMVTIDETLIRPRNNNEFIEFCFVFLKTRANAHSRWRLFRVRSSVVIRFIGHVVAMNFDEV